MSRCRRWWWSYSREGLTVWVCFSALIRVKPLNFEDWEWHLKFWKRDTFKREQGDNFLPMYVVTSLNIFHWNWGYLQLGLYLKRGLCTVPTETSFSNPIEVFFVHKPQQSIHNKVLWQDRNRKLSIKKHKVVTYLWFCSKSPGEKSITKRVWIFSYERCTVHLSYSDFFLSWPTAFTHFATR